jgi:hypothetical protein
VQDLLLNLLDSLGVGLFLAVHASIKQTSSINTTTEQTSHVASAVGCLLPSLLLSEVRPLPRLAAYGARELLRSLLVLFFPFVVGVVLRPGTINSGKRRGMDTLELHAMGQSAWMQGRKVCKRNHQLLKLHYE